MDGVVPPAVDDRISVGRRACARSLSAVRAVMAVVAAVVAAASGSWRDPLPVEVTVVVVVVAAALTAREVHRWINRRADRPEPAMIAVDVVLAVGLVLLVGDAIGPLGWVAMAVPVLEALVWRGLVAAVSTWIGTAGAYVVLRVLTGAELDPVLTGLARQMGGSFLVLIPGYAAGSVIGRELDVAQHTRETAQRRATSVQRLADAGRSLSAARDADEVLDELVAAAVALGFSAADVVCDDGSGPRVTRLAGRFPQGSPRADMLVDRARRRGAVSTRADLDAQALHRCGLRCGVAARVTDREPLLVVRLWREGDTPDGLDDLALATTLAAQAGVGWAQATTRADLEARAARLAYSASHDPLTGLANRSGLTEFLDRTGYEMGGQLALLFVDLDGFKSVNDTHGHDAGDEVLRTCARRIEQHVGGGFVARVGGDEFVVGIGTDSIDTAAMIGGRLIAAIEEPIDAAGSVRISASVGVTVVTPTSDVHDMMAAADQAMYAAKRAGGGRVAAHRSGSVAA